MLKAWSPDFVKQPLAYQWLDLEASGSNSLLERHSSRSARRTLSARLSRSSLASPAMPALQTEVQPEDAAFERLVASLPDLPDLPNTHQQHNRAEWLMEGLGNHELDSSPQTGQPWAELPNQHEMQQLRAQPAGQLSSHCFMYADSGAQAGTSSAHAAVDSAWATYAHVVQLALQKHGLTEADVGQLLLQIQMVGSGC